MEFRFVLLLCQKQWVHFGVCCRLYVLRSMDYRSNSTALLSPPVYFAYGSARKSKITFCTSSGRSRYRAWLPPSNVFS